MKIVSKFWFVKHINATVFFSWFIVKSITLSHAEGAEQIHSHVKLHKIVANIKIPATLQNPLFAK